LPTQCRKFPGAKSTSGPTMRNSVEVGIKAQSLLVDIDTPAAGILLG